MTLMGKISKGRPQYYGSGDNFVPELVICREAKDFKGPGAADSLQYDLVAYARL